MSVVLLRHLAHGCADTQAALTADGMVSLAVPVAACLLSQSVWPLTQLCTALREQVLLGSPSLASCPCLLPLAAPSLACC
jgi:hypothetical protein